MKNKVLLTLFTLVIISVTQANCKKQPKSKKEPIATNDEINAYLFKDPKATHLDDYKNNITLLQSNDESKFNLEETVSFKFIQIQSNISNSPETFTYAERESITPAMFDPKQPLRVVIHGWQNKVDSPMIMNITDAYKQTQNVTLMVVDWSTIADENYLVARNMIDKVANVTAYMLHYLVEKDLINLKELYLIGHSLGAHTVGMVGKKLQVLKLGKVPLVIALDPAGPLFTQETKENRLDRDDGELVAVLHTSTLLGYTAPLGHIDFYANYGFSQPGCSLDLIRSCAHSRAYMYFADALLSGSSETEFWAVKCNAGYEDLESERCDPAEDSTRFGETVHMEAPSLEGLFLFETNSERPWAKGVQHLENLRANDSSFITVGWKVIIITSVITLLIAFITH